MDELNERLTLIANSSVMLGIMGGTMDVRLPKHFPDL